MSFVGIFRKYAFKWRIFSFISKSIASSMTPHLMYSFLIVAFSGINLALLAQASCLDFILSMNFFDFSIVLLASASTYWNELCLCPKRGLYQSSNKILHIEIWLRTRVIIILVSRISSIAIVWKQYDNNILSSFDSFTTVYSLLFLFALNLISAVDMNMQIVLFTKSTDTTFPKC